MVSELSDSSRHFEFYLPATPRWSLVFSPLHVSLGFGDTNVTNLVNVLSIVIIKWL